MAKEQDKNYTPAQEAIIREFPGTGANGALRQADAETIAADPRMNKDGKPRSARSIIAKIGKMELPYERKAPTRKDGSAIASKAKLVDRIAELTGAKFETLGNAGRDDLVALRDAVERLAA